MTWTQFTSQHTCKHTVSQTCTHRSYDSFHVPPPPTHTHAGPPGCGKSVTVRVVAASLGFEVMEWTPPVPTLWADHQYMVRGVVGGQTAWFHSAVLPVCSHSGTLFCAAVASATPPRLQIV
jgi:hypothetical protein